MARGRSATERVREGRSGWDAERVARGDRVAVYAVATADRLGRDDLAEVRVAASLEDERDPVVRLARWFDAATYPLPAPLLPGEALKRLEDLDFDSEIVEAFRAVQPLIQPVGME